MKIGKKEVNFFKNLSGDKNLIHTSRKFAKNFFFKEPIVHGVDLAIRGICKFLKKKKNNIIIDQIKINFKNFTCIDENFKIHVKKNRVIISNALNTKIEIDISIRKSKNDIVSLKKNLRHFKKYNYKNLINSEIIGQLIFISRYVGSVKPGNGSLIHKISLNFNKKNIPNKKIKLIKKTKTVFLIKYVEKFYFVEIIASKLVPFKNKFEKPKLSSRSLRIIKNKKILIFGASGDLAKLLARRIIKKNSLIYKHSYKVNFFYPKIFQKEINKIKNKIYKIKPNFIFYFSSPAIFNNEKNNKKLFKFYKTIYVDYFKIILKIIHQNNFKCKIFYPSTYALNQKEKFKRLESYLKAKEKAERVCNTPKFKKFVCCYRLPQLISRSNYNMLGFYEGEKLSAIDSYFDKFFNCN